MKNLIVLPAIAGTFFLFLTNAVLLAQAPVIEWQKSLGGSGFDYPYAIQNTADGGYIMAGSSQSDDGDVSGNHGSADTWIVKLSKNGAIEWQKTLGGSNNDDAISIHSTVDGGYVVAGSSSSDDGDVSGNHGNADFWVLKLNATGDIEWQKSLGGTDSDFGGQIKTTSDGGYIMIGITYSNDGNISGNHGNTDGWVVKLGPGGDMEWQKSLGGTNDDALFSIENTNDGGYIIAGQSNSKDGDASSNHGNADFWVVKLNSTGAIQWQKSLGGPGEDIARSIQPTADGGYIVAGYSDSNINDVSGNHGNMDYWISKLSSTGTIQWQKSLGGTSNDYAESIRTTMDGGFIVAGYSYSDDGNVTVNRGFEDYWIVKLHSNGAIQWQKSFGGTFSDLAGAIEPTSDGGYILAGSSNSNDGDVTDNKGLDDCWIVKIAPNTSTSEAYANAPCLNIYPVPSTDHITISLNDQLMITSYAIYDLNGALLLENRSGSPVQQAEVDLSGVKNGTYLLEVISGNWVLAQPVIIP